MGTTKIYLAALGIVWIALLSIVAPAFAQSDSLLVESEVIGNFDRNYALKYEYLDVVLADEPKLLKFAVQPFKPNEAYDFAAIVLQAAYERKLSPSLTLLNEINSNLNYSKSSSLHLAYYALGIRWYPGLRERIENQVSGNNCNGYYAGVKINHLLDAVAYRSNDNKGGVERHLQFQPIPEISLGIQQRLKNRFYVDASTSFNYDFKDKQFGFGLTVLLGFSFNVED